MVNEYLNRSKEVLAKTKERLLATKEHLSAIIESGQGLDYLKAKFNLSSIDYVSQLMAVIIVWFTYASLNTIEMAGSDDVSAAVSEIFQQLIIQAALTIIALYLFSASAHIIFKRSLLKLVLIWFSVFAVWEVINVFNIVEELTAVLQNNIGLVMACGNDQQDGLVSSFAKDPNAAAGFALLAGIDISELQAACAVIGKVKFLPYLMMAYEIAVIAGIIVANRILPINELQPHTGDKKDEN